MRTKTPCVVLAIAATACATARTPGVTEHEVVFGITAPLSGPAAAWGALAAGAQAWAAHANARGGINGRRIRVLLKDDGYVPGRAVANVTEMKDSVFAVLLLLGTSVINANKDLVAEAGLPVVFPAGNPRIWAAQPREKRARVFVAYPDYENEGEFLAAQVAQHAKRVAVFYQNDDYGKDGVAGLKRGAARAGLGVAAEVPYELQDREMGVHALKMKDSGAEAVVLFSTATHAANLVKEMAKVGHRPMLFASFPLSDHHVTFRLLGELWEGAYFANWGPALGEPGTDRVVDVLLKQDEKLKGREGFAALGAIGMMLALEGVRRAGPDLTRESFVAALESIRDWAPEGFSLTMTFGPERHHGWNAVRLVRAGKAADLSFIPITEFERFPPLF